jgi:hypothetical protein
MRNACRLPGMHVRNQALACQVKLEEFSLLDGCHAGTRVLTSTRGGSAPNVQQKARTTAANCVTFCRYGVRGGEQAMRLSQMWREHLQAGRPREMRGLSIAGTAVGDLDAEITACVSACVTHSLKMDSRIERRLHDISYALEHFDPVSPEVAEYCSRLNKLVGAVLVNAGPAMDPPDAGRGSGDSAQAAVRPGVRRR